MLASNAIPMPAGVQSATDRAALARIEVYDRLEAVEGVWREFESKAVVTPYQRFDWISAWHRHLGMREQVAPLIVVGFDHDHRVAMLLPLGVSKQRVATVARFLGGKHANYNFGLWRADIAASMTRSDLNQIQRTIRADQRRPDLLILGNQPESWEGVANPLLAWPNEPSPSNGYRLPLHPDVLQQQLSSSMRGRMRNKARKFEKMPGFRYLRASSSEEVARLLAAFLDQKASRFAAQGIGNVFSGGEVEAFLHEAANHNVSQGCPTIELHALVCDAEVLALLAGVNDGKRFSAMFNSHTSGEGARWSPGLVLVQLAIEDSIARGLTMFDLGVGEAEYKTVYCSEPERLFDAIVPLSVRGYAAALPARGGVALKRRIKQSETLWKAAREIRRLVGAGFSKAQGGIRP